MLLIFAGPKMVYLIEIRLEFGWIIWLNFKICSDQPKFGSKLVAAGQIVYRFGWRPLKDRPVPGKLLTWRTEKANLLSLTER